MFAIVALSGIMSRLLTTGTVLVATSNRAPRELNQVSYSLRLSLAVYSVVTNFLVNVVGTGRNAEGDI